MIDDKKLVEFWKTPYSERFKYVKSIIENEVIPMYLSHINKLTSLVEAATFKMTRVETTDELYEALSRLNGALRILESLVNNLTYDVNKVITIVLAPKTVLPSEQVKS
jgi:hypothetical protein